jgi:hypothetical protein
LFARIVVIPRAASWLLGAEESADSRHGNKRRGKNPHRAGGRDIGAAGLRDIIPLNIPERVYVRGKAERGGQYLLCAMAFSPFHASPLFDQLSSVFQKTAG